MFLTGDKFFKLALRFHVIKNSTKRHWYKNTLHQNTIYKIEFYQYFQQ